MRHLSICSVLALATTVAAFGQINLLTETFDGAGSSATFDAPIVADGTVTFGFDYSAITLTAPGTPVDATAIPEAPNTPGGAAATSGVAMGVNLAGGTANFANIFTALSVSGDYEAQVDVFYYHDNNSGSTEDALFGINHSGAPIHFGHVTNTTLNVGPTDGYFFKTFGDIDVASEDHFLLEGQTDPFVDGALSVSLTSPDQPGTAWGDGLFPNEAARQALDAPNTTIFETAFTGFAAGATTPGLAIRWVWQEFRMQYSGGVVSFYVNDSLVCRYTDPDGTWTSGKVLLGHEDSFGGSNAANLMIFDNLIINQFVVTSVGDWNMYE
jgi:hypothetical protein